MPEIYVKNSLALEWNFVELIFSSKKKLLIFRLTSRHFSFFAYAASFFDFFDIIKG